MRPRTNVAPPQAIRAATIPDGSMFEYGGRWLRVVRVVGNDPAAPVIAEEMTTTSPTSLKGQLSLWGHAFVAKSIWKGLPRARAR